MSRVPGLCAQGRVVAVSCSIQLDLAGVQRHHDEQQGRNEVVFRTFLSSQVPVLE